MMCGAFNPERFCRIIEQIFSERDGSEVKVTLISKKEKDEIEERKNKTA